MTLSDHICMLLIAMCIYSRCNTLHKADSTELLCVNVLYLKLTSAVF